VEDNVGEPPSGDNDKAEWENGCRQMFCDRYPDMKNLLDSVLYCKDFLQQSPKWEAFEKKKEEALKKKRPKGTKKAKQESNDEKLVKRVISVSTDEKSKKKHRNNKDRFMAKSGDCLDAISRTLADKNDTDLLGFCSPTTQKKLAAELVRERIKRMQFDRQIGLGKGGTLSSLSCEVGSGSENEEHQDKAGNKSDSSDSPDEWQKRSDKAIPNSAMVQGNVDDNKEEDDDDDESFDSPFNKRYKL
jgi:hypothetical protein